MPINWKKIISAGLCLLIAGCNAGKTYDEYYSAGLKAYNNGEWETAIEELSEAVKKDPLNNEDLRIMLADAYLQSGDHEMYITVLEKALEDTGSARIRKMLENDALKNARLLSETHYNMNGDVTLQVEYAYNTAGMLKQEVFSSTDGQFGNSFNQYEYDETGKLVEKAYYTLGHPNFLQNYILYEYDEDGNMTREIFMSSLDTEMDTTYYIYEDGKLVRSESRQADGTLNWYYLYEYEGDQLVTRKWYSSTDVLQAEVRFEYNASGKVSYERNINPDGSAGIYTEYIYNEYGRLTEKHLCQSSGKIYETIKLGYEE